jgi:D-alanyl-D-alanine carboxypeptidase/D-alanyl-D-alanine-endopeptidase (penicillin-binding protein 4)
MSDSHDKRRVLVLSACASLLLVFTLLAASRSLVNLRAQTTSQKQPRAEKPETRKDSTPQAAAPAVSKSGASIELGRAIDRAIDESELASAEWGVYVVSLRDGRVLYARNSDKLFTPASNMKLYTTAVALDQLGADYRWRTSVYSEAPVDASGTIKGDIILYGRGAPDLASQAKRETPNSLDQLADELYRRGVRRVTGGVVGDESYFRGEPLGDGWLWNDVQWYFGAEVSALSINSNETTVTITSAGEPGEKPIVKAGSATDYFQIKNDVNTTERGSAMTLGVTRGLSENVVRVWGDFPAGGRSYNVRLSVHKPALWAATLFRNALKARGITVEGDARMRDARARDEERFDTQRATELASVTSRSLGEIARSTNKESLNLNAELILRTLGKERGASAPDPDQVKMRLRGDDQAGLAVVRLWLQQAGIRTETLTLRDGSGLSRLDLVTPEATTRLLVAMAKRASAQVFRDSLPIAGRDGTLSSRMRGGATAGRILAKTGTLTYTNSLSGYVMSDDNEPLAFSILCNEATTEAKSTGVIDAIATRLASYKEANP